MSRLVQLTDPHLFVDAEATQNGVRVRDAFRRVVAAAAEEEPDLLLLTGDIAHDELPATYDALSNLLGPLEPRTRMLPGNHDNRGALLALAKPYLSRTDTVSFVHELPEGLLVGLDSHVPGEVPGELDAEQLRWLGEVLDAGGDRPAYLFMHHPSSDTDPPWEAKMALTNASALGAVLEARTQVRAIFTGHVHMDHQTSIAGVPVYTCPSTAYQFTYAEGSPSLNENGRPGYRVIDITRDGFSTGVRRTVDR